MSNGFLRGLLPSCRPTDHLKYVEVGRLSQPLTRPEKTSRENTRGGGEEMVSYQGTVRESSSSLPYHRWLSVRETYIILINCLEQSTMSRLKGRNESTRMGRGRQPEYVETAISMREVRSFSDRPYAYHIYAYIYCHRSQTPVAPQPKHSRVPSSCEGKEGERGRYT